MEDDFTHWSKHFLSLAEELNLKMKILPQVNYLFLMLPVTPTDEWFKSPDSLITQFYWKNKNLNVNTTKEKKSQGATRISTLSPLLFVPLLLFTIYLWSHVFPRHMN